MLLSQIAKKTYFKKCKQVAFIEEWKYSTSYKQVIYKHELVCERDPIHVQYCAKVMQMYFAEICGFSWLFDEKI